MVSNVRGAGEYLRVAPGEETIKIIYCMKVFQ